MENIEVTISWNENIPEIVDAAIVSGLNLAGVHLQGKMRQNFGTDSNGVLINNVIGKMGHRRKNPDGSWKRLSSGAYAISGKSRNKYRSSPPGGFPGIRTGRLRQSVGMIRARKSDMVVTVGTNLKYGRYLEYGYLGKARDGSRFAVPARPWCRRTFNEERGKMVEILRSTAQKEITAKLGGQ